MSDKQPSTSITTWTPHPLAEPPVPDYAIEPWRDPSWQKLWLSVQGRAWSSLALVPAAEGAPIGFGLSVAAVLARIGIMHLGVPIQVADGTGIPLMHLAQFEAELGRLRTQNERVLIALSPVSENPITVPLAQAADAAVLCVLLEAMSSSEAKRTVDRIGATRFVGSAIFQRDQVPPAKK
jgi:hypothetical protein